MTADRVIHGAAWVVLPLALLGGVAHFWQVVLAVVKIVLEVLS